jgi:SAM-dependent methyltransferase
MDRVKEDQPTQTMGEPADLDTAAGFADYFRTLGPGSRYTPEQFLDFFAPLDPGDFAGKDVVELGFGHGSFLAHWTRYRPARLSGIELGDTVDEVRRKLAETDVALDLHRGDLTRLDLGPHDLAYCIGVIHHLQQPEEGFRAVLRHTKAGGHFHCWTYALEGHGIALRLVDALRELGARLSWRTIKWTSGRLVAVALFVYARILRLAAMIVGDEKIRKLPASIYALSIANRDFAFVHFLATDFLVARHTVYLDRATLEGWLRHEAIEADTVYLIHRNANSWKFGGRKKPIA